jgi:hypothetical protein
MWGLSGLLAVYAVALFDTAALTAASVVFSGNGSALTAAHFWQTPGWPAPPKVSKRSCPLHLGLAALDFPRSIIASGARREGPSLAHRGSRGIHAAQPLTQRFRSAC